MKRKVLFVGSFVKAAKDGSVGGQMFACRSLIESPLSQVVDFILLDSTAESVPAPSMRRRSIVALKRFTYFLFLLGAKRPDSILIFSSSGFSFLEKGLMVLLSSPFCSNVIFAPRSGLVIDNINSSAFFKMYARLVFRAADKVVCQGEFWKHYFGHLSRNKRVDKMKIIPNWINVNEYVPVPVQRNLPTRFIYIGWLEKYKGICDLIEAARMLKEKNIHFELHVYGDGRLKRFLQESIALHFTDEEVIYHGWIKGKDKINALSAADVVVLPSHREGFPNALLEAMAYQKVVLASDIGVVPEIISHKKNGLMFKSGSAHDLMDKMIELIYDANLQKATAFGARKTVEERYSIESAVSAFKCLLGLHAAKS